MTLSVQFDKKPEKTKNPLNPIRFSEIFQFDTYTFILKKNH